MEEPSTRGTGRTTRLVKATPRGGFYVVSTSGMGDHIRNYLKQLGRPMSDLNIVAADDDNWHRGRKIDVLAIDHTCYSEVIRNQDIFPALHRATVILYNDADGDIILSTKDSRGE